MLKRFFDEPGHYEVSDSMLFLKGNITETLEEMSRAVKSFAAGAQSGLVNDRSIYLFAYSPRMARSCLIGR